MKKLLLITISFSIISCGILKSKSAGMKSLRGTISVEEPYCGGAEPSEEQAKGGLKPLINSTYYLKKSKTNDPNVIAEQVFTTDESGDFSIKLEPGLYAVLHPDKLMNFGEFKLKNKARTNYYTDRDNDCFQRWYNSPDFLIQVNTDTTVVLNVKSRCYTGSNPCVKYDGPMPP